MPSSVCTDMPEVLIPVQSPVFCAWGMMGAVRRSDLTRSFFMEQERWDADALSESIARLMRDGVRDLTELGVPEERRRFLLEFEMRYIGQHHEISVAFDDARQNADCKDALNEAFHRTHRKIFTYAEEDRQWEIVHLHLACSEEEGENMLFASDEEETTETRTVCGEVFGLNGLPEVPVYSEGAAFRKRISGPAMIRQTYTTVVIPCGCVCDAAGEGVLRIQRRTEA